VVISRPPSSPCSITTFITPGGRPASSAASAKIMAESGVSGLGRRITELPAISAGTTFQKAV
jgi:hypothetical protein